MTTVCGALLFAGPSPADAKVLLPNCGFSEHGGRAAPRSWDHGCIGGSDLVRATWRGWANRVAFGRGRSQLSESGGAEGPVHEYPARARVWRIRTCKTREGTRRRFYTRLRLTVRYPPRNPFDVPPGDHTRTLELGCDR